MNYETALDGLTIELDYDRPLFSFPDLRGEEGNPFAFYPKAANVLKEHGFHKESKELSTLMYQTSYDNHFNTIARYLDYSHVPEQIDEDNEYVYLKVKKGINNIQQIHNFRNNGVEDIKEMIKDQVDFTKENTYGRNLLHYLDRTEALEFFLKENHKNQWIDLLSFDNFNGHFLHTTENVKNFNTIFEYLLNDYPDLAGKVLHMTNHFDRTPFYHFNHLLGQLDFSKEQSFEELGKYLKMYEQSQIQAFGEFDKKISKDYLSIVNKTKSFNSLSEDDKRYMYKIFMESSFPTNNDTKKSLKI